MAKKKSRDADQVSKAAPEISAENSPSKGKEIFAAIAGLFFLAGLVIALYPRFSPWYLPHLIEKNSAFIEVDGDLGLGFSCDGVDELYWYSLSHGELFKNALPAYILSRKELGLSYNIFTILASATTTVGGYLISDPKGQIELVRKLTSRSTSSFSQRSKAVTAAGSFASGYSLGFLIRKWLPVKCSVDPVDEFFKDDNKIRNLILVTYGRELQNLHSCANDLYSRRTSIDQNIVRIAYDAPDSLIVGDDDKFFQIMNESKDNKLTYLSQTAKNLDPSKVRLVLAYLRRCKFYQDSLLHHNY